MCPIWTSLKKKKRSKFLWKCWGEVEHNCLDVNTKIGGGLREPQQRRLSESYRCWACLWWVWTGTVRTWRSHACIFSCSSSLQWGKGGMLGKVSTKGLVSGLKSRKDFHFDKVLQQGKCPFLCPTLLAVSAWPLCRCVAEVMIMSEWREVTGDSTRKCVCVPARLLRGSRVKAV